MAEIGDIASYIYSRAQEIGVDPNLALGIARYEGLNPNTIGSPTFGNRDARGYSFGPFQLFSGSPDPSKIAPGGMAYEFQQKYGSAPSRENWQQQVDFSLDRIKSSGTSPWYAVRDRGGPQAVSVGGQEYARSLGLLGTPEQRQAVFSQPDKTTVAAPAGPIYSQDLGTYAQRFGNAVAPDWVEAAKPITAEEAIKQQAKSKELQDLSRGLQGFLSLMQLGRTPQQQEPELPAPKFMGGQFRPLAKMRGFL
jgi:hypothetical protein